VEVLRNPKRLPKKRKETILEIPLEEIGKDGYCFAS